MKALLVLAGIISLFSLASTESNFYPIFDGGNATRQGAELVQDMKLLCDYYAKVQSHFNSMTAQIDTAATGADQFQVVAKQFGFRDIATNTVSNDVAQDAYGELNSMVSNTQAAIGQGCSRFRQ